MTYNTVLYNTYGRMRLSCYRGQPVVCFARDFAASFNPEIQKQIDRRNYSDILQLKMFRYKNQIDLDRKRKIK